MNPLYFTGRLTERKFLVGGIARMWFQHGFPIDMSFELVREQGNQVDWAEALADAWLNDVFKYDAILHDIAMLEGADVAAKCDNDFKQWGANILSENPKLKEMENPVNEACKVILKSKRESSAQLEATAELLAVLSHEPIQPKPVQTD